MTNRGQKEARNSLFAIGEFIPLIWKAMRQSKVNCAELSRLTGITATKLSRGLGGTSQLDHPSIQLILVALGIDMQRALIAIGCIGDWNRYYDPDVVVLSGLVRQLPETLAAARDGCERAEISDNSIKIIAGEVGAMIANHDRKVSEHRDAFHGYAGHRRIG